MKRPINPHAKVYQTNKKQRTKPPDTSALTPQQKEAWDFAAKLAAGEKTEYTAWLSRKNVKDAANKTSNTGGTYLDILVSFYHFPENTDVARTASQIYLNAKTLLETQVANAAALKIQRAAYAPTPRATDSLEIEFLNVGSGDSILISTPKGKTIVVDCGQRARPDGVAHDLFDEDLRNHLRGFVGTNALYALILTHPDEDHYKLVPVVVKNVVSNVLNTFYSMKKIEYEIDGTATYLNEIGTSGVVSQVETLLGVLGVTVSSSFEAVLENYKFFTSGTLQASATGTSIQILGKDDTKSKIPGWDEDNCRIWLLSGGYCADQIALAERTNGSSIVTLIEVHGRKILLMGDATKKTETFLNKYHAAAIKDVDILHMEHHGAGLTHHAGDKFVETVNPRIAVISSGPHEGDWNPRWETISKYLTKGRICKGTNQHHVAYAINKDGFVKVGESIWANNHMTRGIFSTHSSGHLGFCVNKTGDIFWNIMTTEDAVQYRVAYCLAKDASVAQVVSKEKIEPVKVVTATAGKPR